MSCTASLSWHTVVAPLTPKRPRLVAAEASFLAVHATRATKVALPSPYLLGIRMWDEGRSRDAYPTRETFMRALVPVLREEFLAVRDAGVTIVQFDDPHLCLLADPRVRAEMADPDAEAELCVSLLNEIVRGVDGIITALHLCRRNKERGGWIGAERVSLNPDCGFAPGSAADIPVDEAYAKLRSEAGAAALLRRRHHA